MSWFVYEHFCNIFVSFSFFLPLILSQWAVVITEMVSNVDDVTQRIPVTTPAPHYEWSPPARQVSEEILQLKWWAW